jgi:xyloglucan-specific exo-beta-1,4-glucanase
MSVTIKHIAKRTGLSIPTILLSIILTLITASVTQAQTDAERYVWRNVTIGAGGFIPGIVFSRVEKGLVYLRSDMGGCYRWDNAANIWIPLEDELPESSYMGGESIAPDPVDANVVYVAAGMYRGDPAAMLRSADRGKTWDVFPVSFRMGGNEDGRGVGERLAIDPNDTHILYFGSRHDGLMRSVDSARNWRRVDSFPLHGRGTPAQGKPTNTGLSFVVFDLHGQRGVASKTIFVGSADPGPQHLFRSDDAGEAWQPVEGGPGAQMLPAKAEMDDDGLLYITYGNGTGPNGVTSGAVWVLDTKRNQWTDITPDKDADGGGFCGLSLDRQHPGTLAVTTMNRWHPGDTVWRTTDGGKTWAEIASQSQRDVSATPFLKWGNAQARLGWWMAALAIDPFGSDHAVYATGATVYATNNFSDVNRGKATRWFPWVKGIEQTAVTCLISPTEGPHLISGLGDIGGFAHEDLDQSPPLGMFASPRFDTTVRLDYAGERPSVIVRAGHSSSNDPPLAMSEDSGQSWRPLILPADAGSAAPEHRGRRRRQDPGIAVSADGKNILVTTSSAMLTTDQGRSWTNVAGLPSNSLPVADRVNPRLFYAIDFDNGGLCVSSDGGATFQAQSVSGLPADMQSAQQASDEAPNPLSAVPDKEGNLWLVSHGNLFRSIDGGKTFSTVSTDLKIDYIGFGRNPPGRDEPALFAIGTRRATRAIWRSDDSGSSWIRLNDEQHEWGQRFRCITGDPRIFGRVYVGTDGRGILYGEPTEHP